MLNLVRLVGLAAGVVEQSCFDSFCPSRLGKWAKGDVSGRFAAQFTFEACQDALRREGRVQVLYLSMEKSQSGCKIWEFGGGRGSLEAGG